MALDFQHVPILFAGLNTKRDEKNGVPGEFEILENAVYTRIGRIQKRRGYDAMANAIHNGGGTIDSAAGLATFRDELLCFSGTEAYSYMDANDVWKSRGACFSVVPRTASVLHNAGTQTHGDVAVLDGVRCEVWEDSRGGVRYSIHDVTTGADYVSDVSLHATAVKPRVVVFDSDFVIFYASGANLYYRRISARNPGVLGAQASDISTLDSTNNHYDVMVNGSDAPGARYLWVLTNDTSGGAKPALRYYTRTPGGTAFTFVDPAISPAAAAWGRAVALWTDDSLRVWCAGATSSAVFISSYTFGAVAGLGATTVETVTGVYRICGYVAPGSSTATVLYERETTNPLGNAEHSVRKNTVSTAGTVGTAADVLRSVGLLSRCFDMNGAGYVCVGHGSALQPTNFLMDLSGNIVARTQATVGGGWRTKSTLSSVPTVGSKAYVAFGEKGRLESEAGVAYAPVGLAVTEFDFDHVDKFKSATIASNLLIAGGLVYGYDGAVVNENGFHLFPENLVASTATPTFAISVTTPGGVGVAEVADITLPAAVGIRSGQYFTINGLPGPVNYYVWFNIDGEGGDPALGGMTGVEIAVTNANTAAEVAEAVKVALDAKAEFTATRVGPVVTVTQTTTGAVDDPAVDTAPTGVETGSVDAGTHYYAAVYEWTDHAGQVHRSAPSQSLAVTTVSAGRISIIVPTLRITGKSDVRIAIYRTEEIATGTIFYRVSAVPATTVNSTTDTTDRRVFVDVLADADITSNDVLYTDGDYLDHIAPLAANVVVPYRKRVFLAGLEDRHKIAYSLLPTVGDPAVAFNDSLTIDVPPAGGPVTALCVMDDKLVIFTEQMIYALSGDGPTNAGTMDDFSVPAVIATDIGAKSQSSVSLTTGGIIFEAHGGGIYMLDRALSVSYLGAPVEGYKSIGVSCSSSVPESREVRCLSSTGTGRVFNYEAGQWSTFTQMRAVACCMWRNQFVWARADGRVMGESETSGADDGVPYRMRGKTSWVALAGPQGFKRVQKVIVLGSYKGPHKLQIKIAVNFGPVGQYATFDAGSIIGSSVYGSTTPYGAPTGGVYGGAWVDEQFDVRVEKQKCQAIQLTIEDIQADSYNEGYSLSGIALLVGMKRGHMKLPANRRA